MERHLKKFEDEKVRQEGDASKAKRDEMDSKERVK